MADGLTGRLQAAHDGVTEQPLPERLQNAPRGPDVDRCAPESVGSRA